MATLSIRKMISRDLERQRKRDDRDHIHTLFKHISRLTNKVLWHREVTGGEGEG